MKYGFAILFGYLLLMNLMGFLLMKADKRRAVKHRYRISESCLFLAAWLGGSIGCWIGMYTFRHKTKKKKFVFGIPFVFIFETAIALYMFF
jgi:uncharacterized membrane protein YsdA (DUF1294 family)